VQRRSGQRVGSKVEQFTLVNVVTGLDSLDWLPWLGAIRRLSWLGALRRKRRFRRVTFFRSGRSFRSVVCCPLFRFGLSCRGEAENPYFGLPSKSVRAEVLDRRNHSWPAQTCRSRRPDKQPRPGSGPPGGPAAPFGESSAVASRHWSSNSQKAPSVVDGLGAHMDRTRCLE
jgi:hypothetical protein